MREPVNATLSIERWQPPPARCEHAPEPVQQVLRMLRVYRLKPRVVPALFGLVCIGLGLGARAVFAGHFFWWKVLGVLLWCWTVHACVRFVNPRLSPVAAAVWMVAISFAVELLQLTDLPRWLSSQHWFLRQVFGEVFSPWDLLQAFIAGLLIIPVDTAVRRLTRSTPAAQTSPASARPCSHP